MRTFTIYLAGAIFGLIAASTMATACWASPSGCGTPGAVTVQVLGSGGPIADDKRASSAYLLWIDGAARVLIDFGGGAFLRFGEAGGDFRELDFIGISHLHTDHSSDLPALLKSGYFSDRSRPLQVAGPEAGGPFPGLEEFLNGLLDSGKGAYRYLAGYLDGTDGMVRLLTTEISSKTAGISTLNGRFKQRFEVDALYVPHGIVPTISFRIRIGDRAIVFSSDQTGDDPKFIDFARNADLLIMHMAIPKSADSVARRLHATPEAIGRVAKESGVKKLLLSHFMARSLRNLKGNVAVVDAAYEGPILVAEDLMCIAIHPG